MGVDDIQYAAEYVWSESSLENIYLNDLENGEGHIIIVKYLQHVTNVS